jgi:hypothetical protein
MRRVLPTLVGLCLALTVPLFAGAGCGSSGDANDAYLGTWRTEGNMYMEFRDDGTFGKGLGGVSSIESDPWEYGTFTFDGETLRLTTAEDSPHCGGFDAEYRAEPSEDGTFIAHTVINDPCSGRERDFGKGIQRYP